MTGIDALLRLAEDYQRITDVPETTVSWRVFNDSKKLGAMRRDGAGIGVRRLEASIKWFSENWPKGHDWPDGIDRPETVATAPTIKEGAVA